MILTLVDGTEMELTLLGDDLDLRLNSLEGEVVYPAYKSGRLKRSVLKAWKRNSDREIKVRALLSGCTELEIHAAADVLTYRYENTNRWLLTPSQKQDFIRKAVRHDALNDAAYLFYPEFTKVQARRLLRSILTSIPKTKKDSLITSLLAIA